MKTYYSLLVSITFLFLITGCSKTEVVPETQESAQLLQANCPTYFYYMGSQPTDLGPLLTDRIIIGFKKGTNQVNKMMAIASFPELDAIVSETQTNAAGLTIVSLQPNLDCNTLDDLLKSLPSNPHIDFAGGYFDYEWFPGARIGITNTFVISLKQGQTVANLQNLLKETKTEIFEDLGFGTYIIRLTKQSPQNTLRTANQFYESGLFETAEPDFLFEFPPMQ